MEYTLITLRETGSENRFLFFTEYRFPDEDSVPRSQEIRTKVTTGVEVSEVKFDMQAKRDGVATKDFTALIVSEYEMFEARLLKKGAGSGDRFCVIISGKDFRDFNTRYEESHGFGLMLWEEYSRQMGHTDGKNFIEKYVLGIESGTKEFQKLLHVRLGNLEPSQKSYKSFTAIVLEEAVFLLPGQEGSCSPVALYEECCRLGFGDKVTKTKLGEKGREKRGRVKFTFKGIARVVGSRIVVLTARRADITAKSKDLDVIPVEATKKELADGNALQIVRGRAWESVRDTQLCNQLIGSSYPKAAAPFVMKRTVQVVAEAWIRFGKEERKEREYFLIYLEPRDRDEMRELVFLKNSDVEMEGSSIDLVVMPKESSGGQRDLDSMEAVLKIKEPNYMLNSYQPRDNIWYLHGPVRGKTRLSAEKKQR